MGGNSSTSSKGSANLRTLLESKNTEKSQARQPLSLSLSLSLCHYQLLSTLLAQIGIKTALYTKLVDGFLSRPGMATRSVHDLVRSTFAEVFSSQRPCWFPKIGNRATPVHRGKLSCTRLNFFCLVRLIWFVTNQNHKFTNITKSNRSQHHKHHQKHNGVKNEGKRTRNLFAVLLFSNKKWEVNSLIQWPYWRPQIA